MSILDLQLKLREIKFGIKTLNRQIKYLDNEILLIGISIAAVQQTIKKFVEEKNYVVAKKLQKTIQKYHKDLNSLEEIRATIYLERERLGRRCIAIRRVMRERNYTTMLKKQRQIKKRNRNEKNR